MIIAVYNHKGGVGKSTLTSHIGFRAIERKVKIAVFDADRQSNTMSWLSGNEWDGEDFEIGSVVVSNDSNILKEIQDYKFIIVDCPPSYNIVDSISADIWIIPVDGRFATDGCMNVITEIRNNNSTSRVIVVNNRALIGKFGSAEMKQISLLQAELFKFPLQSQDVVRKAEMTGVPAWKVPYGSRSATAQNLQIFSDWVIDGCKSSGVYLPEQPRDNYQIRRK